jgi:hypothetical protein
MLADSPTMMLDRMGTIGSTHGVNASAIPPRKNKASEVRSAPSVSIPASACSSVCGTAVIAAPAGCDSPAGSVAARPDPPLSSEFPGVAASVRGNHFVSGG